MRICFPSPFFDLAPTSLDAKGAHHSPTMRNFTASWVNRRKQFLRSLFIRGKTTSKFLRRASTIFPTATQFELCWLSDPSRATTAGRIGPTARARCGWMLWISPRRREPPSCSAQQINVIPAIIGTINSCCSPTCVTPTTMPLGPRSLVPPDNW